MTRILSITQFLWYSFESISVLRFFGLKASRPVADYIQAAWGYVARLTDSHAKIQTRTTTVRSVIDKSMKPMYPHKNAVKLN
jgi:hypothetical protein